MDDQVDRLFPHRLAAVIRWDDSDEAYSAVLAAARSGIGSVEVTSGTPNAFELVARLSREVGADCVVGAGTITSTDLARDGISSGAQYLVSPYLVPEIAPLAREAGVLLVMGAATPGEIASARAAGAGLVKVFPAGPLGGPGYIRAIRGPIPDVPLWVSGGVGIDDVGAYLEAGVRVVALTDGVFPAALLRAHDWDGVTRLCEQALTAAGEGAAVAAQS